MLLCGRQPSLGYLLSMTTSTSTSAGKPDLTDRVVDQVGAVRVVVGGVEDGTGTSQGAVAGEVRAVGNKLDGGLLGSDGRGGVKISPTLTSSFTPISYPLQSSIS